MQHTQNPMLLLPSTDEEALNEAHRRRRTVEMMTNRYMTRIMAKHYSTTEDVSIIRARVERLIDESFDRYVPPDHPPYHMMIINAIEKLNEKGGSTQEAISDHIKKTFPSLPYDHEGCLSQHLSKLGASGDILVIDERLYMLPVDNSVVVAAKKEKRKSTKQKKRGNQRVLWHKQSQGKPKAELRKENQIQKQENSGKAVEGKTINVTDGEISDKEAGNKEVAEVNNEEDNGRFCMNGDKHSCLEKIKALKKLIQCKERVKGTKGQGGTKRQLTEVKRQPDCRKREQNALEKNGDAGKYLMQVDKTIKIGNEGLNLEGSSTEVLHNKFVAEERQRIPDDVGEVPRVTKQSLVENKSWDGSEQNQAIQELKGIHGNQDHVCQEYIPSDQHLDVPVVHHCSDPNCCFLELQRLREEVAEWERKAASCRLCKCSEELKCLKEEMLKTKRQMQKLAARVQKDESLTSIQGLANGPLISELDALKEDSLCLTVTECDGACQEGQHLQQIQDDRTAGKKSEQDDQIEVVDTSGLKRLPDFKVTAAKGGPYKRKRHPELSGQPDVSIPQPVSTFHQPKTERQLADPRAVMSQQRSKLRPRAPPPEAGQLGTLTEAALSVTQFQDKAMVVKQVRGRGRPPKKVDTKTSLSTQHQGRGRPLKQTQDTDRPAGELQLLPLASVNHEESQPLLQIEYHGMQTSNAVELDTKSGFQDPKLQCKQKQPSGRGRGRPPKLQF